MTSLKEDAKEYEPTHIKNIADLEIVSVDQEIKHETRKNKSGEEYPFAFVLIAGEEYRVPNSVREQLKAILEEKPDMKSFKVTKKGEGLGTSYTVIPME